MLLAALAAALAVALLLPPRPRARRPRSASAASPWLTRWRLPLASLAGVAGVAFLDGPPGVVAGVVLAGFVWVVAGRAEDPAVRRSREQVARELPQVVRLLGLALASGAPVPGALGLVAAAFPGASAEALAATRERLALGVPEEMVWEELADQPGLQPLARALARSARTGASSADVVARLADDLAERARGAVEDRARAVGIRAAVPLGVCLLPAFVLLGIVPVIAATLSGLGW